MVDREVEEGALESEFWDPHERLLFEPSQFAEKELQRLRETQDLQKAMEAKVEGRIKPYFLDLLPRAVHAEPCAACRELLDLLVLVLVKKRALKRIRTAWFFVKEPEDFAEQVAYLLLPRLRKRMPVLLSDYQSRGLDAVHAYHSFAKYCRLAAERQANRECAALWKSPGRIFAAFTGRLNLSVAERLECPRAHGDFEGVEVRSDLQRWADGPDCRVSERAWRMFVCHQVTGLSARKVAELFNTTEGAVSSNSSRVWGHVERAGFIVRDDDEDELGVEK